jgi:hypothetical protein
VEIKKQLAVVFIVNAAQEQIAERLIRLILRDAIHVYCCLSKINYTFAAECFIVYRYLYFLYKNCTARNVWH